MNKSSIVFLCAVAGALLGPYAHDALAHLLIPEGLTVSVGSPADMLWSQMHFRLASGACAGLVPLAVFGLRQHPPAWRWLIALGPMLVTAAIIGFWKAYQAREGMDIVRELHLLALCPIERLRLYQIPLGGLVGGLLALGWGHVAKPVRSSPTTEPTERQQDTQA